MAAIEKHYEVAEVAELWSLSVDTIRQIFRTVPGVLRVDRPRTRNKRGYLSMRIPESVMQRVHQHLTKAA